MNYKKIINLSASVAIILSISACASPDTENLTDATGKGMIKAVPERTSSITTSDKNIYICRIKSIIRMAEAPDLYINDLKLFELSNGEKISYLAKEEDNFLIKTSANPFVYRFKDEMLLRGKIKNEPIFIVLKAERNLTQGVAVLFGGAIIESVRQNIESGESKNWTIKVVSRNEFTSNCDE